jgi:hypothetical protein
MMASIYVNDYRPWPAWIVESLEEIAHKFGAQVGTYRGHADDDHGDMTGQYAADIWFYDNTAAKHDALLAWFKANARRIGGLYIITRRRIWNIERADEGVRYYAGPDPHTSHAHISYQDEPPEDDMALSSEDKAWLRATIRDEVEKVWTTQVITPPEGVGADPGQKWTPRGTLGFIAQKVDTIEEDQPDVEPPA